MTAEALKITERYDKLVREMEDKAIARLNRALEAAYAALEKDLVKNYKAIASNATLLQATRRALILSQLGSLLQIVNPDKAEEYEKLFATLTRDASDAGFTIARLLTEAIANESHFDSAQHKLKPFAKLDLEGAAAVAKNAYERLLRNGNIFADTAVEVISVGVAQGWGVQRIMQPLQQQLGITKSRAESIVRYEAISAYNDMAVVRYKESDIEWTVWVAIGDRAVCSFCLARHMRAYKISDRIRPPIHPRCRCALMPLKQSWVDSGLIDKDFYAKERERALNAADVDPRHEATAFEKQLGISKLPTPVWEA